MEADTVLSPQELRALWQQLGDDESLVEPYELTEHGEVVMSPRATNSHQLRCSMIATQLQQQLGPHAVCEVAVLTKTAGVRVPDVAWMPPRRWSGTADGSDVLVEAPDLVVEVLSPGNRKAEVAHKVRAYLASGVREVVVVAVDGTIAFHRQDGVHADSALGVKLELPFD